MPSAIQLPLPLVEERSGRNIVARFIDRLIDARQREVEAKVARFLERQGANRLTDGLERDIARFL